MNWNNFYWQEKNVKGINNHLYGSIHFCLNYMMSSYHILSMSGCCEKHSKISALLELTQVEEINGKETRHVEWQMTKIAIGKDKINQSRGKCITRERSKILFIYFILFYMCSRKFLLKRGSWPRNWRKFVIRGVSLGCRSKLTIEFQGWCNQRSSLAAIAYC